MMNVDDVTLGEVWRNVEEIKSELKDVAKDVHEMKTGLAGFTGTTKEKVDRLEKVVYGTIALALTALGVALFQLVLHH